MAAARMGWGITMTNTDQVQGVPPATGLYAIADRLAQPIGEWRACNASGALRWFFRIGLPAAAFAAG